ncbi:copper amine oxidase N-terminal domain-containing protein [bacterium]|nr:MAG: copper amine oxidase N-terminal domain-containing protein [bacterium]
MLPIVQLVVDGRLVQSTQPPRIIAGSVFVPFDDLRFVAQRVWFRADDRSVTVQRADRQIVLFVGQRQAWINGRLAAVARPPLYLAGELYVPLAVCARALAAHVTYQSAGKTLAVTLPPLQLQHFTPPPTPFAMPVRSPAPASPAPSFTPVAPATPTHGAAGTLLPQPRRTPLEFAPSWP